MWVYTIATLYELLIHLPSAVVKCSGSKLARRCDFVLELAQILSLIKLVCRPLL